MSGPESSALSATLVLIRVAQQNIDSTGAPIPAGGGAKGENLRAQTEPVIDLALENRLSFLGAISLAMDDLGATEPTPGAGCQKFVAELFGEGDGQAMEIQLQFPGDSSPLEIVQDPPLHAGFGIEEEFMGLDLCLRQAEAPLILSQMFGLGDRVGRRTSTPGFRLVNIKRRRVFNLGKEELAFIRIEEAAHGCSAVRSSCM